jgi:hypothetical protein
MTDDADIQEMLDKQRITEVLYRYSRGADRLDVELLRSVFFDDATVDYGSFFVGTGWDYSDYVIEILLLDNISTQHVIGNILIEVTGDAAYAESYAVAHHARSGNRRTDEAGRVDVWGGRYVDRLERRGGQWRIARRVCIIDWSIGHSPAGQFAHTSDQGKRDRSDPSYVRD